MVVVSVIQQARGEPIAHALVIRIRTVLCENLIARCSGGVHDDLVGVHHLRPALALIRVALADEGFHYPAIEHLVVTRDGTIGPVSRISNDVAARQRGLEQRHIRGVTVTPGLTGSARALRGTALAVIRTDPRLPENIVQIDPVPIGCELIGCAPGRAPRTISAIRRIKPLLSIAIRIGDRSVGPRGAQEPVATTDSRIDWGISGPAGADTRLQLHDIRVGKELDVRIEGLHGRGSGVGSESTAGPTRIQANDRDTDFGDELLITRRAEARLHRAGYENATETRERGWSGLRRRGVNFRECGYCQQSGNQQSSCL